MKDVVSKTPSALIYVSVIMLTFIFAMNPLLAQEKETSEASGMHVKRIIICKSVVEREPVGEGESFPADITKVFCFTDVRNAGADTFITHEWYYKDELKATVRLKVAGAQWRTWSSKGIDKNWTGKWNVKVKDADGNLLCETSFIVGEEPSAEIAPSEKETEDKGSGTKDSTVEKKDSGK
jgi:hypothetical protein